MTTESEIEYVVLCGRNHERVGYAPKSEVHHANTPLHLAFSCYVFDSRARLLVTHRAHEKRTWPGVRTNSCCGHPGPDEPIEDAVRRRLRQELGVEVGDIDPMLPEFNYFARMGAGPATEAVLGETGSGNVEGAGIAENEVCPVFRATVSDAHVDADPDEVAEATWVPWSDYLAEVEADSSAVSPWSAMQVAELAKLGPDPLAWQAAGHDRLPPAARDAARPA